VVIDQNVKQASTNAQGVAALTGLAAGAHDVHVFADGYTWVSALQVNAANLSGWIISAPFG
ncbi:MAG: hypothetical protein R8K47_00380, partial [Mariprofundaceae bacterium]